ncbi:unnamed protein product [Blepharisma stoltei]|uniref:Thioredoxin domain-containing protein n=1 Tax=Blepharisma stoltei TaxID=1481888 RepID=A0AAU9JLT3_9CILI|nr:unnamed protein product [Blepharisma stoltei]
MPPRGKQQEFQITVRNQDHLYELISGKKLTIVDLFLAWCGPCELLSSSFRSIAMKIDEWDSRLQFLLAETDKVPDFASHQSSCKPRFLFFLGSKLIGEVDGADVPKIQQMINRHLPPLEAD